MSIFQDEKRRDAWERSHGPARSPSLVRPGERATPCRYCDDASYRIAIAEEHGLLGGAPRMGTKCRVCGEWRPDVPLQAAELLGRFYAAARRRREAHAERARNGGGA